MAKSKTVKVIENPNNVVTVEVLADSIKAIADGVKRLRAGRLNDRALYLLIQHACPSVGPKYTYRNVTQAEVKAVLEGIANLEKEYLK